MALFLGVCLYTVLMSTREEVGTSRVIQDLACSLCWPLVMPSILAGLSEGNPSSRSVTRTLHQSADLCRPSILDGTRDLINQTCCVVQGLSCGSTSGHQKKASA